MKVKAISQGYYGNKRRRIGEVFDMAEEHFHAKNAKGQGCKWAVPLEGKSKKGKGKPDPLAEEEMQDLGSDQQEVI